MQVVKGLDSLRKFVDLDSAPELARAVMRATVGQLTDLYGLFLFIFFLVIIVVAVL